MKRKKCWGESGGGGGGKSRDGRGKYSVPIGKLMPQLGTRDKVLFCLQLHYYYYHNDTQTLASVFYFCLAIVANDKQVLDKIFDIEVKLYCLSHILNDVDILQ